MLFGKKQKVRFNCMCIIHELSNLPYVTGQYFSKWKLSNSTIKGCTQRATVKQHKVVWDSIFSFDLSIAIGKDGYLKPFEMIFSVKQEIDGGAASERLGIVTICLAHLASSGSNTQRYLLEDAKSNSLLKITIQLKLIEGDVDFKVYLKVIRPGPSSKTHFQQEQTPTAVIKADQMVSPDNRYSMDQLDIMDPENKESDLVDQFFASATTPTIPRK